MDLPKGVQRQFEESERRLQALLQELGMNREGLARLAARMRFRLPAPASRTSAPRSAAARRGLHV